jgi:hypothetical protein
MRHGTPLAALACAIAAPPLAQDAIRQSKAAGQLRTGWIVVTTVTPPPR